MRAGIVENEVQTSTLEEPDRVPRYPVAGQARSVGCLPHTTLIFSNQPTSVPNRAASCDMVPGRLPLWPEREFRFKLDRSKALQ